jgi:outer membrane protein assembly factor BamD (BamD/ComL family)
MRFIRLPVLLLCVFFALSCSAVPTNISDTVTPAELVQRAQEASDRTRYTLSLGYYEEILKRFPGNNDYVCAAEYEIGFIHYKQKKYDIAESELRELLGKYDQSDAELLPPQYKILANIVITKIEERTMKRTKVPRR